MFKFSFEFAIRPIYEIWGDIVANFFVYLIAIFIYDYDVFNIKKRISSDYIAAFIYYCLLIIFWICLRFLWGIVKYCFFGEEIIIEPQEYLVVKTKLVDKIWIERPIWLKIGNNSNDEIKDCKATIIALEHMYGEDYKKIPNNKKTKILDDLLTDDLYPRLNWSHKNISNKNCEMNISQKPESEMVEIAKYRMSLKDLLSGKLIDKPCLVFTFCGSDKKYIDELGLYRIKLQIDYKFKGYSKKSYFDGYIFINLEEIEDEEQGLYINLIFKVGNPLNNSYLKEIYGWDKEVRYVTG